MKLRLWMILGALAVTWLPGTLWATNTVLSGIFDGSETRIAPLPGTCSGAPSLGYRSVSGVQVSASGSYSVVDAFNNLGVDVTALLYSGSFNPNAPQSNLLTPGGIDEWAEIGLSSGTNYVLVVQHWCFNREGAWAVTFSGPGSVNSASAVSIPALTQGSFSGADPIADTDCGDSQYRQTGPVQVTRSGAYYYRDISYYHAVDMCLQVYTAPFNPANPNANRVGDDMDDLGAVELQAGEDYYFVAQPSVERTGEHFVFAPPALLDHARDGRGLVRARHRRPGLPDGRVRQRQQHVFGLVHLRPRAPGRGRQRDDRGSRPPLADRAGALQRRHRRTGYLVDLGHDLRFRHAALQPDSGRQHDGRVL
jgi:hypothetical protein